MNIVPLRSINPLPGWGYGQEPYYGGRSSYRDTYDEYSDSKYRFVFESDLLRARMLFRHRDRYEPLPDYGRRDYDPYYGSSATIKVPYSL